MTLYPPKCGMPGCQRIGRSENREYVVEGIPIGRLCSKHQAETDDMLVDAAEWTVAGLEDREWSR